MSFFLGNTKHESICEEVQNLDELQENYICAELYAATDATRKAFLESQDCKVMLERGLISKKTIIRLNKTDDLARRIKMATFQIAKEKNDPIWQKLVENRKRERMYIRQLQDKYKTGAIRSARVGQRDFLSQKMSAKFIRPDLEQQQKPGL